MIERGTLVRWVGLLSQHKQTATEFVFKRAETTSFRRSRTDVGADLSTAAVFICPTTEPLNIQCSEIFGIAISISLM